MVAITPEHTATMKDWPICPKLGEPDSINANIEMAIQSGKLAIVIPSTR
jgi:hypothetical protein